MVSMPFLTQIDSRAQVRGSRDPLGVQAIWTRMGRHVVGNLTTVSTSVRDFTTTLLGFYFAERVAEEKETSDDLNVFLRWEQLADYARGGINGDWSFRGTERAKKNWNESDKIRLGIDAASLILSDQKTYGLWGLYSVPSRTSGLLEGSPTRLTAPVRECVEENYMPMLDGKTRAGGEAFVDMLSKRSAELKKERDGKVLDAVAKALKPKFSSAERALYVSHLVEGGLQDETKGGQKLLAEVLRSTLKVPNWELSPAAVRDMAKKCRTEKTDVGDQVAAYLERILAAERLLAPCVSFFGYLLGSDGQSLDNVAKSVKDRWGSGVRSIDVVALQSIEIELRDASGEPASGQRWIAIATALREGDYAEATRVLLVQNRDVMAMRGGAAPWAEMRDGKLHVKFAAEVSDLPTKKDLVSHWTHPYFIPSLREIARQLEP